MYKYLKEDHDKHGYYEVTEAQTYRDLIGTSKDITETFNQLKQGKIITTEYANHKVEEL